MIIRKAALQELMNDGFRPMVIGARGEKVLMRGEDYEICLALRLRGWRLWYEPRLQLKHYMPAERLKWGYLRGLLRGVGASDPGLYPYYFASKNRELGNRRHRFFRERWQVEVSWTLRTLLRHSVKLVLCTIYPFEGDPDILMIERSIGSLLTLVRQRKEYELMLKKIQKAPWRRT
jgi:cellulose synthase/poly-beta-1,6-N-acetylglucosamine synthase-like glycosyltransferase